MQKYSTYLTKQTDKNLILRTKISKIHFQKMSWRFTAISIGYAALIASVGLGLYAFCFREYNACFIALLGKFKVQFKDSYIYPAIRNVAWH